jgi:hypothetical protein
MKNQEMNVFELCRRDTKMSTDEMLSWGEIALEYGYATELGGRYLRRIGNGNLMEFSCLIQDFDRWANSRAEDENGELQLLFDLDRRSDRRAFLRYVESIQEELILDIQD